MLLEKLSCLTFNSKIDVITATDAHGIVCRTSISCISTSGKCPNPKSRASLACFTSISKQCEGFHYRVEGLNKAGKICHFPCTDLLAYWQVSDQSDSFRCIWIKTRAAMEWPVRFVWKAIYVCRISIFSHWEFKHFKHRYWGMDVLLQ